MTIFTPIEETKAKGKVKKVFDNIKKERKQVETNHACFIGWRDRIKIMASL